jgi:very-short-patch-repair endonuclease
MDHDPRLVEFARKLRREITPAEKVLWQELRGRRFAGYRFRRQHVVDPYIADFYCAVATLVIELDGETHLGNEEKDKVRQSTLESRGLKVLRFWNNQVFVELDAVLEEVYRECQQRAVIAPRPLPPRRARKPLTPNPSPQRGEGRR